MRELTAEMKASVQTPEMHAHFRELVAEPGQRGLAMKFLAPPDDDGTSPLGTLHTEILGKCAKPLSPDWESKPTLWELGDEVCSAYGLLTLRGLISWELLGETDKWFVANITPTGAAVLSTGAP